MKTIERELIRVFNKNPAQTHTTTKLVQEVFPDEYATIRQDIRSQDAQTQKAAKRTKAKLHRKLLYYLNKLVDNEVLRVAELKERGEKSYQLQLQSGELIIQNKNETITISNQETPKSYVLQAQEDNTVHQYNNTLHKIESYAINAKQYPGITHLQADLNHLYAHIADSLLITNFNKFFAQDQEVLKQSLLQLHADSQDYEIAITLHINLNEHTLSYKDQQFISAYALHHPKRLYLLFSASKKEIRKQNSQLTKAIQSLAQKQVKVNIHNTSVDDEIHYLGETGAYRLESEHQRQLTQNKGVVVVTGSLAIDCAAHAHAKDRQQLIINCAKTLLSRATTQRRVANRALAGINKISSLHEQLSNNTTYLRLWNYTQNDEWISFISEAKHQLKNFCKLESNIYSACGVPIEFSVQLSTAFPHYAHMSKRKYTKKPVYKREHLTGQQLGIREQLLRIYATDRVRIFREGNFTPQELLSEVLHITDNYKIPLLTYDFKELQKTISLEKYL